MNAGTGAQRKVIPIVPLPKEADDEDLVSLYASQKKIYPRSVQGIFARWRWGVVFLTQLVFYGLPWLDFGQRQAVLFDLGTRRFYIGPLVLYPQDFIFLTGILIISAYALFLFTALYGRLWCGYACPQTVFLEEWIRPIESWLEGSRSLRMARDKLPWSRSIGGARLWDKVWRRAAKWTAFALVAATVAMAFMSWFVGARVIWGGQASPVAYGLTGVLALGMFVDFTWFREQFCNYLCPYARFQGALTDTESLVVAYDDLRGEPRRAVPAKSLAKKEPIQASVPQTGACIDCKKCVAVCPQGIDIRGGFQLECISCARCVDACEDVFAKLREKDPNVGPALVGYTALQPASVFRPRTLAYGVLLAVILGSFGMLLAQHHHIAANLDRAPGMLYVIDPDGWTRNTYLLQVTNNEHVPNRYAVTMSEMPSSAELTAPAMVIEPGKTVVMPVIVRIPPHTSGARTLPLMLTIAGGGDAVTLATTFKTSGG
jgi:cytochrome c oxidase accessory protein FixG